MPTILDCTKFLYVSEPFWYFDLTPFLPIYSPPYWTGTIQSNNRTDNKKMQEPTNDPTTDPHDRIQLKIRLIRQKGEHWGPSHRASIAQRPNSIGLCRKSLHTLTKSTTPKNKRVCWSNMTKKVHDLTNPEDRSNQRSNATGRNPRDPIGQKDRPPRYKLIRWGLM